ncbi:hypothetical protein C2G38_499024 [Gigaspora rosea]|uniref:RNA polymerase II elongation factor ELL N-terminal domain-containing protein n=1 Tax=Gigaspora rosea TaxID=44941 RepID=A0A397U8Z2_9GLOM|nr:hypothetical protein C2G38_499024 [Gigaspora rosea]
MKPKNPKANRPPRRKDPSMSYCVPASSSFISNDDTSGVPLRKRVVHLMAATEFQIPDLLSTDQIVTKVKDSKEKVQKVLDEVAELTKKGTWKLTNSAWLTLEPYNWSIYRKKEISDIVQRMNEIADQMGIPQDSPQRPRQPKLPNHSANIDVGESSSRKRIKTGSGSFSEVQQSNDSLHPGTIRTSKSSKAGKNTKGRGAKTLTSLHRHDDDDIEHDSKNVRGAKSIRGRGNKTTTTTNASITAEPVTGHANQQNARPKRGRPLGSKTSRANKTSTVKNTIALSNIEPSKPETNEVNGHTLVNGINNEIKQNKYRVNTLTEFQDLIEEFNTKQNEYHELDSKLAGWFPLYNELSVSLRSARQSREKPIINRIMETFGSGSEVFSLVEQFNAVEEELCQISAEAWRAAKEGILDE